MPSVRRGNVSLGDGMQDVGCMECMGHFVAFDEGAFSRFDHGACWAVLQHASLSSAELHEIIHETLRGVISVFTTKL